MRARAARTDEVRSSKKRRVSHIKAAKQAMLNGKRGRVASVARLSTARPVKRPYVNLVCATSSYVLRACERRRSVPRRVVSRKPPHDHCGLLKDGSVTDQSITAPLGHHQDGQPEYKSWDRDEEQRQ